MPSIVAENARFGIKYGNPGHRTSSSPFPLKSLVPDQPFHQRGAGNPVMTADQKGIQGAGIGIFHGGMLGQLTKLPQRRRANAQQLAHFARSVHAPIRHPLRLEQGLEQGFRLCPEFGGRVWRTDASQTAYGGDRNAQSPLPLSG